MHPRRRWFLVLSLGAALFATAGFAAPESFSARLSDEKRQAAGISKLSDPQRATLDNLVERETRLARQGNVRAFAAEFSDRRSAPERAKAGIDAMSPDERAQLNALVAAAIAEQPQDHSLLSPVAHSAAVRGVKPKPIVHGHVSFTVGTAGGGRNFYGGSVYVEQTDPQKGYTIGIGYSEYRGDVPWFFDDYRYGWGYGPGYGFPYSYGYDRYGFRLHGRHRY